MRSHFHHEKKLELIQYKKFPFRKLQGKLPCSEKPSRNSCHQSNTSNPKLPSHFINMDFCLIYKSVCSSTDCTMTRIYTGRSGVQILAHATAHSLLQNIQTSSSAHPAFNSMTTTAFSLAVNWPMPTI